MSISLIGEREYCGCAVLVRPSASDQALALPELYRRIDDLTDQVLSLPHDFDYGETYRDGSYYCLDIMIARMDIYYAEVALTPTDAKTARRIHWLDVALEAHADLLCLVIGHEVLDAWTQKRGPDFHRTPPPWWLGPRLYDEQKRLWDEVGNPANYAFLGPLAPKN